MIEGKTKMFTEYFQENAKPPIPAISVHQISRNSRENSSSNSLDIQPKKGMLSIFFCIRGSMTLINRAKQQEHILARELLLLTDNADITSTEAVPPFEGICVTLDRQAAQDSFLHLCQLCGDSPITARQAGEPTEPQGGVHVIHPQPWTTSMFQILSDLSPETRSHYCVIKSFELLYLTQIHCNIKDNKQGIQEGTADNIAKTAQDMRDYMLGHLSEKISINDLSQLFHRSPTSCKKCFRTYWGQSIHSWLLDRRMERAADLLEHSMLSILQIAQAISYEGTSQFNAAFKLKYGITPSQYRKNAGFR